MQRHNEDRVFLWLARAIFALYTAIWAGCVVYLGTICFGG